MDSGDGRNEWKEEQTALVMERVNTAPESGHCRPGAGRAYPVRGRGHCPSPFLLFSLSPISPMGKLLKRIWSFRIFVLWGAGLLATGLGFGQEGSGIALDMMLRFGSPNGEYNSSRRLKPTESGGAGILATLRGSNSYPQGSVQPLQG
jgi:hypothetical protein